MYYKQVKDVKDKNNETCVEKKKNARILKNAYVMEGHTSHQSPQKETLQNFISKQFPETKDIDRI